MSAEPMETAQLCDLQGECQQGERRSGAWRVIARRDDLTREREQGSYNLSATRTSYLDFHLLHMDTLNIFSIWSSYFYKNYLLINKYHFFFSSSVASCKPSLSCTRHPFLARLPAFRSSLPNSVDQHHCSFPHASIFSFLTSRSVTASNLGWSLCADARL